MKTADEMFRELGYTQRHGIGPYPYYTRDDGMHIEICTVGDGISKSYTSGRDKGIVFQPFTIEEFHAAAKKLEEMEDTNEISR